MLVKFDSSANIYSRRSQFHQRFMRAFFVHIFCAQNHKAERNKKKAAQIAIVRKTRM
jgi:hypothetical protein